MKLECKHRSRAEGETFVRCLTCLAWRFAIGGRWWPESYELPWLANESDEPGEVYQIAGVRLATREHMLADEISKGIQ